MTDKETQVLVAANRIVESSLLNANVESFGIMHQVPFIQFRNEQGEDSTLSFDSGFVFSAQFPDDLTQDEKVLLSMNKINLKQVEKVFCTAESDLEIYFEGGLWLRISGTSEDGYEPWQLSDEQDVAAGGTLLIACGGGGYAIWQGNS